VARRPSSASIWVAIGDSVKLAFKAPFPGSGFNLGCPGQPFGLRCHKLRSHSEPRAARSESTKPRIFKSGRGRWRDEGARSGAVAGICRKALKRDFG
jgi:hypothetical protein